MHLRKQAGLVMEVSTQPYKADKQLHGRRGRGLQRKRESPVCMEKHAQVWRIAKREIVVLLSLGKAEFSCREPIIYIYSQQVYLGLPPHTY